MVSGIFQTLDMVNSDWLGEEKWTLDKRDQVTSTMQMGNGSMVFTSPQLGNYRVDISGSLEMKTVYSIENDTVVSRSFVDNELMQTKVYLRS